MVRATSTDTSFTRIHRRGERPGDLQAIPQHQIVPTENASDVLPMAPRPSLEEANLERTQSRSTGKPIVVWH